MEDTLEIHSSAFEGGVRVLSGLNQILGPEADLFQLREWAMAAGNSRHLLLETSLSTFTAK